MARAWSTWVREQAFPGYRWHWRGPICASSSRDRAMLCVVESPADVAAIEQSGSYRGTYFVLMGHLSPLDGIGPGYAFEMAVNVVSAE